MMIKITERCTMGCTHCLNDAKPDGKDMTVETFIETLNFCRNNNIGTMMTITGGEPTEHREFGKIMNALIKFEDETRWFTEITITTNGEDILIFQVSTDSRYYPRKIQTHKRIFREPGFVLCEDCVESVYPQGRALLNCLPYNRKSPNCFNVRALVKQGVRSLNELEMVMLAHGKFCTPHISINGEIKLGESDLCPVCASIHDDPKVIIEKIKSFNCNGCKHIVDNLEEKYRKFLM